MVHLAAAAVGIIEGAYTAWTSLGLITLEHTPALADSVVALVDCQNNILNVAYQVGSPSWATYYAAYQLPALSLISDNINWCHLADAAVEGSGHGNFSSYYTTMVATVSGLYDLQLDSSWHILVNSKGVELQDITPTFIPYRFYFSPDGEYIVITESSSPRRIEVFQGA